MTKTVKNIYRAINASKLRLLTIALVIAIGIISFNGMITAYVHMMRTYETAFEEHHMASFTMQTANPGGSGEDAWIDYVNLTNYINRLYIVIGIICLYNIVILNRFTVISVILLS